jgi:formamidopyrimidine-DNA glycosylase
VPELPEAEFGRKLAAQVGEGQRITDVRCAEDEIVFCGRKAREVEKLLRGRRMQAARRRGKYIWFELDKGPHPIFHFGMTGAFRNRAHDPLKLASHGKQVDAEWPPRFEKIWMSFEGGGELVMTNARRLGRIRFADAPLQEAPLSKLGFDPLTDMPKLAEFRERIARRKGVLKGLMLNQSFAAGVGNWIADEVLYQAKIDPRRRAETLRPDEVKALHARLRSVIKKAVAVDARKDEFPRNWLFHQRWGKNQDARMPDGSKVVFVELAGRTTAWVPERQG